MRVKQEKIPSVETFINTNIKVNEYPLVMEKATLLMKDYLELHLKAIRYEYNQYQFFLDGYRNGSASIGEVNDAHYRFIKLLENDPK